MGKQEIKAPLESNSDDAVTRGVFGASTYFVGEKLYLRQDRLEWVAQSLDALPK